MSEGTQPAGEGTQPGVRIRRASAEDAPAVASVLYESFLEYEPSYTPGGFAATVSDTEQVRGRIKEEPVWVALKDEKIVGTVGAVARGDALYVRSMAVVPAARGGEIGRRLLGRVEEFAAERGFRRLFLSTTPFLARAIKLYEQFGFRRSDEGPHDLFGTPLFTMVKCSRPSPPMPKRERQSADGSDEGSVHE